MQGGRRHRQDALDRGGQVDAEPGCHRRQRRRRARRVEPHAAAGKGAGIEEAAGKEGIGQRRPRAAASVAGRAGIGARAFRSDLEHAGLIEPDHRSAAGADRRDADHRHHDRKVGDVFGLADLGAAILDEGDVGAGAADVERDQVALPRAGGDRDRADHPRGRSGQQGFGRCQARAARAHDPAVGTRDVGRGADAGGRHALVEPAEIARHRRHDIGVHDRDDGTLVFAHARPDLRRTADEKIGRGAFDHRACGLFVGRIAVGVEKADDDAIDPGGLRRRDRPEHAIFAQRRAHGVAGAEPFFNFEHTLARDQRGGAVAIPVLRPRHAQALDDQQVAKTPGHEQGEPRALALDQRIDRDRRAVDEIGDRVGLHAMDPRQSGQALDEAGDRIGRHGGRLPSDQPAGLGVEGREIGEGAADIDADAVTGQGSDPSSGGQ